MTQSADSTQTDNPSTPPADESLGKTVQWAPSGNNLDGIPGEVLLLLAENGRTFGYAGGPGRSIAFGRADGSNVYVTPRQWVTRYPDDRVTVTDERPADAREVTRD